MLAGMRDLPASQNAVIDVGSRSGRGDPDRPRGFWALARLDHEEANARQALIRTFGPVLAPSRIEPLGPGRTVVENAPIGRLRQRMGDLDDVAQGAQARAGGRTTPGPPIRGADHRLGAGIELVRTDGTAGPGSDPPGGGLSSQRAAADGAAAGGRTVAAAEVDAMGLGRSAAERAEPVDDACLALAERRRTAAPTGPR